MLTTRRFAFFVHLLVLLFLIIFEFFSCAAKQCNI